MSSSWQYATLSLSMNRESSPATTDRWTVAAWIGDGDEPRELFRTVRSDGPKRSKYLGIMGLDRWDLVHAEVDKALFSAASRGLNGEFSGPVNYIFYLKRWTDSSEDAAFRERMEAYMRHLATKPSS